MKTLKKPYIKILFTLILLPTIVAISLYTLNEKGFFQINEIEIKVNALSSQKKFISNKIEVLNLRLKTFKGVSLWKFPLNQVAQILKQEKWIKDFQLSRSWAARLVVEIQTEPIAFLVQSTDRNVTSFYPVTEQADVLDKIDSRQAPNVILVQDSTFLKNKAYRQNAIQLIKALPKQGVMHPSQVAELGLDKKEGYWLKLISLDSKITLGEDQFEIKSSRVAQVLDYLEKRDLKARVIDANLSKKVLVRMH